MMDELKQQFYEVMHKYQKPFSEEGVTANLTQWYEQKQGLLQLLRKHPLWNEKELAIVFRVEERREIDRITVDETRAAILELGRRACTDDTVYENFEVALRAATADYARIPNEYRLDTIRQYGGIKCAPGQKASRIINRLCLKFHLDQIEEEAEDLVRYFRSAIKRRRKGRVIRPAACSAFHGFTHGRTPFARSARMRSVTRL